MARPKISGETLLLAAMIGIHLVPIWTLPFFPTQDGPAHLAIANTLREYSQPEGQVLREYFELNRSAAPNWFIYFVLADLLRPFPVPAAEKILLSAFVVLLPLSMRYAVRAVEPDNGFLAVLALPFTFNFLLSMGFYNFCFSLVAFLFALGWWLKHRERFGPFQAAVLAALALWVYFCHAVSLVALTAAIGGAAGWQALVDLRHRRDYRPVLWMLAWPALAFLPAVAMTVWYANGLSEHRVVLPMLEKLRRLVVLTSMVSFDRGIRFLSTLLAVSLAGLAVWLLAQRLRTARLGVKDAPLAAVLALLALYLVSPDEIGIGSFIIYRLNLFPFLVLVLWLATFPHSVRRRVGLQVLGVGVSLAMLGLLVPRWRELNVYLAEYTSAAEHIEPGRTLLALSFSHTGESLDGTRRAERIWPFVHAGGHIAARKPVADLGLYAAKYDVFPIRFRPERHPHRHLNTRDEIVFEYPEETGGRVDYVLTWWPEAKQPSLGRRQEILERLESGFNRVYTSPRGLVRLYRSRWETTGARALPAAR